MFETEKRKVVKNYYIRWTRVLSTISRQNQSISSLWSWGNIYSTHQNLETGHRSIYIWQFENKYCQVGHIEHQGNIEQSNLFYGNSLNSTAMSQDVCDFYWSLQVSVLETQNFINVPPPLTFFFCLNNNLQTKNLMLWDKALIES